jgi:hypothetical protein
VIKHQFPLYQSQEVITTLDKYKSKRYNYGNKNSLKRRQTMSPEFIIGGRKVEVVPFGKTVLPYVIMGESSAKELQILLAGRAWVNFYRDATFPVRVDLFSEKDNDWAVEQIVAFLRANDSRWFLPRL